MLVNTVQAWVIMSVTALDPPPLLVHMHSITNETSRSVRDVIYVYIILCMLENNVINILIALFEIRTTRCHLSAACVDPLGQKQGEENSLYRILSKYNMPHILHDPSAHIIR